MVYHCPYCSGRFNQWTENRCPHCAKTLLPPRASGIRDGKAVWTPSAGRPGGGPAPKVALSGRPLPLMLVIGALLLSGVALVHRAQRPATPDERGNRVVARKNMEVLSVALDLLREDIGRFPTAEEGLISLVHDPGLVGWNGPYILELKPDPWGHRFTYQPVSNGVELISRGPDRLSGTTQDLVVTGRTGVARQPAQLWMER